MWWDSAVESGREAVALEFADGSIVELPNVAMNAESEFDVPGEVVRDVLIKVRSEPVAMWHTHKVETQPSRSDVRNLPRWLPVGHILVLADMSVTTYDRSGAISRHELSEVERG